jgi:hypothetical protein
MALATSLFILAATVLFAFIATALGHRALRLFNVDFDSRAEHLLTSSALGVILIETGLFFVQFLSHIKIGAIAVISLATLVGIGDMGEILKSVVDLVRRTLRGSKGEAVLCALVALTLFLQGLAAMAPVTGSDALHYHFTTPALILQYGFHPDFFLAHSFFTGQGHLLILAGLALGSSQLAMGFLFLGGALSAAAAACLARRWVGHEWAWVVALVFLLTPVTFWQISAAGAPDLWMAFFTTIGVIVISKSKEWSTSGAILAGALAGAVAGTKYTGCLIAAAMAAAYVWEVRSSVKALVFFMASLVAGIYPYARNLVWTGDPIFPFLTRWISPAKVNAFTLTSLLADTGAGAHPGIWQVLKFSFFAAIDPAHLGFWQFLGPLVLAFTPLVILAVRNTSAWRVTLIVWVVSAFGIGASSGMARFLLPLLPIALAAAVAGVSQVSSRCWRTLQLVSILTLTGFMAFGAAGFLAYARYALSVAIGRSSRESYLLQRVQGYSQSEFINRALSGKGKGRALIFLRHLYYVKVPFLYGDPAGDWALDPTRFQKVEAWERLFREQDIQWVVRSSEYPQEIATPLDELEERGALARVAEAEVTELQGLRIAEDRASIPVVIFKVKE